MNRYLFTFILFASFFFLNTYLHAEDDAKIQECNKSIAKSQSNLQEVFNCGLLEYEHYKKIRHMYTMGGKDSLKKPEKRSSIIKKMEMVLKANPDFPYALFIMADLNGTPDTEFKEGSGPHTSFVNLNKGIQYAERLYSTDKKNKDSIYLYTTFLMYDNQIPLARKIAGPLGKKDELFNIVNDFSQISLPPSTIYDFHASAGYVNSKYGQIPQLNTNPYVKFRYYYFPGPFNEVSDYINKNSKETINFFKVNSRENNSEPNMYAQFLKRKKNKISYSTEAEFNKMKSMKNMYKNFNGVTMYIFEFDNPKAQDGDYAKKLKDFPVLKKTKTYSMIIIKDLYR
ncbi:MAG: hypothetical protein OEZ34_05490 [Spirochaetia bacterium]|nr:hypothetical protein [Spirochaetia bacterium]